MASRLEGIEFLPSDRRDVGHGMDRVESYLAADWATASPPPAPPPNVAMVFSDDSGQRYSLLRSPSGPQTVPWVEGDPVDPDSRLNGGFMPIEDFRSLESAQPPSLSRSEVKARQLAKLIRLATKQTPSPKSAEARTAPDPQPGGSATQSAVQSEAPVAQSQAAAPPPSSARGSGIGIASLKDYLHSQETQFAGNAAAGALEDALADHVTSLGTDLEFGLSGAATSLLAGYAMKELLGPPPADSASTAHWAAYALGPKLGLKFLSTSLKKLWGVQGDYVGYALRETDKDEKSFAILQGSPNVTIEGLPAARENDPVDKAGVKVQYGSATVRINSLAAARSNLPNAQGSLSEAGKFFSGAGKTFIGLPSNMPYIPNGVKPPVPPELLAALKDSKLADADPPDMGIANPHDPVPTQVGRYFDPTMGEYRIWDGTGWSSTLSELQALPEWGNFGLGSLVGLVDPDAGNWLDQNLTLRNIFEAGKEPTWFNQFLNFVDGDQHVHSTEQNGEWYLLGGFIHLGSPLFPGAGTGSISWIVPDQIFGIDMSSYFSKHDWTFRPDSPEFTASALGGLDSFLQVEIPAFEAGFSTENPYGYQAYNPIHLILQIIYSSFTTAAGFYFQSNESLFPRPK